jgi:hypothetical protein
MRRGLNTSVDADADWMVGEMNAILGDPSWWNAPSGRKAQSARCRKQFTVKVGTVFEHGSSLMIEGSLILLSRCPRRSTIPGRLQLHLMTFILIE